MPRVYLLSPQRYPPEVIAVAFAKASRSPQPLDETAASLDQSKSSRFHEKWVIGYGHASVAEHAVLHIAVEGVSRLAIETLESNRLASYTEKSTRYQPFGPEDFVTPPELAERPTLQARYQQSVRSLFAAYHRCMDAARSEIARRHPPQPGESPTRWDARHRSQYADVCRFLLPAAAQAHLGITINARALAHALRKMLSHPLAEVRSVGEAIRQAAAAETPTLLRYVEAVPAWQQADAALRLEATACPAAEDDWCRLLDWRRDGEAHVLAALLYRFSAQPFSTCLAQVEKMPPSARGRLAEQVLGVLGEHDIPPRELEYAWYEFDVLMDQGAYYEFKRHRMMTQTPQPLSTRWGYALPRLIVEIGLEADYRAAMAEAAATYEALAAWNPDVASYVVPNAFHRRVLVAFNLREAYHFLRLRTAANAHFSIRRVAWRMAEHITAVTPLLTAFLRLPAGETWQDVTRRYFAAWRVE